MAIEGTSSRRTSRRCNARIKGGRYCKSPAGFQTDHPGVGTCHRHGGNNSEQLTHVGMRLAHQGIMDPDVKPGDIVELEPSNALIWATWLSAGDVAYWQGRLARIDPDDLGMASALYKQLREANKEMRSAAKMAVDSGIAERQTLLAERMSGVIATVIQNITGGLDLTPRQEALLPDLIQQALVQMEAPGSPKTRPRPTHALMHHKKSEIFADVDD